LPAHNGQHLSLWLVTRFVGRSQRHSADLSRLKAHIGTTKTTSISHRDYQDTVHLTSGLRRRLLAHIGTTKTPSAHIATTKTTSVSDPDCEDNSRPLCYDHIQPSACASRKQTQPLLVSRYINRTGESISPCFGSIDGCCARDGPRAKDLLKTMTLPFRASWRARPHEEFVGGGSASSLRDPLQALERHHDIRELVGAP
jgi:hypothetical protein